MMKPGHVVNAENGGSQPGFMRFLLDAVNSKRNLDIGQDCENYIVH